MKCPRCGSNSVLSNHATTACVACGHVLHEPQRQVGDAAWFLPRSGDHLGPPLTPSERMNLQREASGKRRREI